MDWWALGILTFELLTGAVEFFWDFFEKITDRFGW